MTTSKTQKKQVIISMTSFPKAITYAVQAIRSLLNGSVLPDKLVLYLNLWQFPNREVPECLVSLERESPIFEVHDYKGDIRSYRKLIPALKDFPEAVIVTVDDDVDYDRHMLRDLLALHARVPGAVIAHRVRKIKVGRPYRNWPRYHFHDFLLKRIHKGFLNLQTGVGGVLYPPHSLKQEMMDADLFTRLAPSTDDIWFWAAATANGTPVIPVPFGQNRPRDLHKPREISLRVKNFKGVEDRNLQALTTILEHFPELKEQIKRKP